MMSTDFRAIRLQPYRVIRLGRGHPIPPVEGEDKTVRARRTPMREHADWASGPLLEGHRGRTYPARSLPTSISAVPEVITGSPANARIFSSSSPSITPSPHDPLPSSTG